jgi:hypothetical protein
VGQLEVKPVPACRSLRRRKLEAPCNWIRASPCRNNQSRCSFRSGASKSPFYRFNIGTCESNSRLHRRQKIADEGSLQTALQAHKRALRGGCYCIPLR